MACSTCAHVKASMAAEQAALKICESNGGTDPCYLQVYDDVYIAVHREATFDPCEHEDGFEADNFDPHRHLSFNEIAEVAEAAYYNVWDDEAWALQMQALGCPQCEAAINESYSSPARFAIPDDEYDEDQDEDDDEDEDDFEYVEEEEEEF